jgi:hypothetical protein
VLEDLAYARLLGAVTEKTVIYSAGYGYEVRPGPRSDKPQRRAKEWLGQYQQDIDWVIQEFGNWTATDLELLATIIFVDREKAKQKVFVSLEELAKQVREVKPRFSPATVLAKCEEALRRDFLLSIAVP